MNFFPNLKPYVKDYTETSNINYTGTNIPKLTPIGYYPSKLVRGLNKNVSQENIKENINKICSPDVWACSYKGIYIGDLFDSTKIQVSYNEFSEPIRSTGPTGSTGPTESSTGTMGLNQIKYNGYTCIKNNNIGQYIKDNIKDRDTSFLDNIDEEQIMCQMSNIMIILGYGYEKAENNSIDIYINKKTSITSTTKKIYLLKNTNSGDSKNNQSLYNACQTVMSRNRKYSINDLVQGGLFYGIKDIFIKLKSLRPLLLGVLAISIYLLVQGTLSSCDLGFNIASLAANRSTPSYSFIIGAFVGIAIPAIISVIMARKEINKTNDKFETYDLTNHPYGEKMDINKNNKKADISLVVSLIVIVFLCIALIYYTMRSKNAPITKILISSILFLVLTSVLFMLFYWAPIVSFAGDEDEDTAYGISRPLKVWLKGDNIKEFSSITSNKYIDRYLRRYFAIYALVALGVTIIYISQQSKPQSGPIKGIIEGIMVSCAILALPILWIFNWYIGIKLFMGYPLILMMIRYLRYPLYYFVRNMYMSDPKLQTSVPQMRQEFNKPENYTASWDLMGITLFKYLIKLNGNRSLYSEIFVDPKDGYKDISSNSYVTGHFFRMAMKNPSRQFDYLHHTMTFIITFIIYIFIIFGVIGKSTAF
jgi:hypothetical protein